jgi:hypothetical protein
MCDVMIHTRQVLPSDGDIVYCSVSRCEKSLENKKTKKIQHETDPWGFLRFFLKFSLCLLDHLLVPLLAKEVLSFGTELLLLEEDTPQLEFLTHAFHSEWLTFLAAIIKLQSVALKFIFNIVQQTPHN